MSKYEHTPQDDYLKDYNLLGANTFSHSKKRSK